MVELALLLPVWLLLTVGLLDLSRVYASYMTLQNATREAARYASTYPTDTTGIRSCAVREAQSSGLTVPADRITISCPAGACSSGSPVKVSANLDFPLISTQIVGLRQITLRAAVQFAVM